jgi:UrcA family protein
MPIPTVGFAGEPTMPRPFIAFVLAAIAVPAFAQPPVSLRIDDLDLDTPAGKATLDARIEAVAKAMCGAEPRTGTRIPSRDCVSSVREEIAAKLEARQRLAKGG